MRTLAIALLFVFSSSVVGEAQEVTAGISGYAPFGIDDLDGELPLSGELRGTIPLSQRFAIEPFVTAGTHGRRQRTDLEGFFGIQIRQLVGPPGSGDLFVTYGIAAYYSRSRVEGPAIGHFGIGLRQPLLKHVAFRPEVHIVTYHVIPVGARFVAGLSVGAQR